MDKQAMVDVLNDLLVSISYLDFCMVISPQRDLYVVPSQTPPKKDAAIADILLNMDVELGALIDDVMASSVLQPVEEIWVKLLSGTYVVAFRIAIDVHLVVFFGHPPSLDHGLTMLRNSVHTLADALV